MTTARQSRLRMERAQRRGSGFSLIELMVALTLGLMIVAAMLANLSASSASNRTNARVAEYQTNGRFAADFLRREVQHSGFLGVYSNDLGLAAAKLDLGATETANYGCGVKFAVKILPRADEPLSGPISGANDTNPLSGSCIPDANYARGDILVLRRAGLDAATTLDAARLHIRAGVRQAWVFAGSTPPLDAPSSASGQVKDYLLDTSVYYISPWTTSATENPKVPALYRMTLGSGPAMSVQLVASGIENMQVQYGVRTGSDVRYRDASSITTAEEWTNVVAVRLWLLARSTTADPGNVSTAAYTMGDQTYPDRTATPSDGFQRQLFPLVVQIRK